MAMELFDGALSLQLIAIVIVTVISTTLLLKLLSHFKPIAHIAGLIPSIWPFNGGGTSDDTTGKVIRIVLQYKGAEELFMEKEFYNLLKELRANDLTALDYFTIQLEAEKLPESLHYFGTAPHIIDQGALEIEDKSLVVIASINYSTSLGDKKELVRKCLCAMIKKYWTTADKNCQVVYTKLPNELLTPK